MIGQEIKQLASKLPKNYLQSLKEKEPTSPKIITSENRMWRRYWHSRRGDLADPTHRVWKYKPQMFTGKKNTDKVIHYRFYNERFYNLKSPPDVGYITLEDKTNARRQILKNN